MSEKVMRLSQVARKLNVGRNTIIEHLAKKGFEIDSNPNTKISGEQFELLAKEFAESILEKEEAEGLTIGSRHSENVVIERGDSTDRKKDEDEEIFIKNVSIDKTEETVEEPTEAVEEAPKEEEKVESDSPKLKGIKVVGKIDLKPKAKEEEAKPAKESPEPDPEPKPVAKPEAEEAKKETAKAEEAPKEEPAEKAVDKKEEPEIQAENTDTQKPERVIKANADKLKGLKVVGKIDLPKEPENKPVASSDESAANKKRRRRRVKPTPGQGRGRPNQRGDGKKRVVKEELSDKEIQDQIKATLAKLSGGKKKGSGAKYRREKRSAIAEATQEKMLQEQEDSKVLKLSEFISANDLASMMDVSVNDIISTSMGLGMFVSINQRLDAEAITVIADEFGYNVEFASEEEEADVLEETDSKEDLKERAPIVTIMGHVDHGKTSLLDYIRHAKVTAGEAGGITQHIGAYDVTTESGQRIAFLDTPGHEAFTAMRARGAKVTDIVIIVVAADDAVMPQTKEAINHAQVAGVPIVIAINKIDRPNANPDKIKEELANINILVEDWGGKYQCQEISAKTGDGVEELLEKVLLESELLELTANYDKRSVGTVIEATLDKGRGYVTTILVQAGTLSIGDVILAGPHFGKVKAMFDHRGQNLEHAGPSTPVQFLGLDGAPQAGDKFNVMESEREAREIATKRQQILREQQMRTKKHITLDEIGRRLAIGSFKELNIIVKGDVDGSIEAISDSLLKLSTDEIQVNIIHKAVGQISESDVLLASASDAIIICFQVRPSAAARRLAEAEEIEMRMYSVIYDAINDVKDAMEGMLAPEVEEHVTGNAEVREIFKITKVGTVAGCMVTDGFLKRSNQIRLIRDGIVVYTGNMGQLKRFKDDVAEVKNGYECGISIQDFNDLKVGDIIEGFEEREIQRKL